MEQTLDPSTFATGAGGAHPQRLQAVLLVLFHPDLRRVGELHVLGPAHADGPGAVEVGRDRPLFAGVTGHPRALADPCISRHQLSIRYLASPTRFQLAAAADARRPIALYTIDGRPIAAAGPLPPDSLIAIGDRILLWVGLLPGEASTDDLGIVGTSAACRQLRRTIHTLAADPATVLVRGETGTGKELVARALHSAGPRAKEPFVAVNCAAISEALIDSELFGHARGAFSGALQANDGLFRAGRGGTVFLDEIGELSPVAQAKLLRTLQERTVRPVGEVREYELKARVVTATHRPLEARVATGDFRADLLARIETPRIELAPLRDRRVDIPILFVHFLARAAAAGGSTATLFREPTTSSPRLPLALVLALLGRSWPRNVRELEKFAAVAELEFRTERRWPAPPGEPAADADAAPPPTAARARTGARPSGDELMRLLDEHEHVARRVADQLGVSRTTLDKWMRELGIRRPADLERDEIAAALAGHGADLAAAAAALRISLRGLKLRLRELGLTPS